MLLYLNYYLLTGLIWAVLHDIFYKEMDDGLRIRLVLFWPITLTAWIIGFINALIDSFNDR